MKHFLFPITLLISLACHSAASDGSGELAPAAQQQLPPGWPISVVSCKMPYQLATSKGSHAHYTCIVVDPMLADTNALPEDFADKLLARVTYKIAVEARRKFSKICFDAYSEHLSIEKLESGIDSAYLAFLLITLEDGSKSHKTYTLWQSKKIDSNEVLIYPGNFLCVGPSRSYSRSFFGTYKILSSSPPDHIKMLKRRNEHARAEKLQEEFCKKTYEQFDITIEVNHVKLNLESGGDCCAIL